MSYLSIFDTSLRDGSQAEHVSFSLNDKLLITKLLDDFGIDYIEGGWPGSNPKDFEYFQRVKNSNIKHSLITVFSSTKRAGVKIEDDANITATIKSEADVACIFGKSWDFHVETALRISLAENCELIFDSISHLKKYFKEVIFDMEHFFDAYKNNPDYTKKVMEVVKQAGADYLVLCDTNGGAMPWEVEEILDELKPIMPEKFGIHAHNDGEMGVANSLVAVRKGAKMVQGTINGFGERCGNANLISIMANAQLKMGMKVIGKAQLKKLTHLGNTILEIANLKEIDDQPFIGKSAFAHKGGVHVSAILRNPKTYEHIDPALVGNARRVLVSDLSGYSNIKYKIDKWNLADKFDDASLKKALIELKKLENRGYAFEAADASFELFLLGRFNLVPDYFKVISYRVINEKLVASNDAESLATVKLQVTKDGGSALYSSEGNGPVDSLFLALKKGISVYYPQLADYRLVDYKVRILEQLGRGSEATVRVLIESKALDKTWTTVGVSFDIIGASFAGLVDSLIYQLFKSKTTPTNNI
ncbi:MAG: citramalate synthase [SAR324 cluster bacterium]|nr:citramalate synthase [SAR324 cluster bacterium]